MVIADEAVRAVDVVPPEEAAVVGVVIEEAEAVAEEAAVALAQR